MIAPIALAALLSSCAPSVASDTMTAIIEVESGRNPFALHDNSTGRSYAPQTYRKALAIANALIAQRHSVDVGLAQINSGNFPGYRTTTAAALFPCENLILAARILGGAYTTSQAAFGEPAAALRGALGAYNTGSVFSGAGYAAKVVAAATVPSIAILTGQPSPTPSARPTAALKPRPTSTPGPWHSDWGSP